MSRFLAPMLRRFYRPKPHQETSMELHESAASEPGVTIIGALHATIDEHERVTSEEASAYERRLTETKAALDDVFSKLGIAAHG